MAFKIFSIGKANAELTNAEEVLAPAIAKAGISTIVVDGKSIPAADAPLSARIAALLAAAPPVANSQQLSDVIVSNDLIAKELEKTKTDLAIAQTSVATLTREKADLESRLSIANKSVETLTAEKADLGNRKVAAENQFTANGTEIKSFNTELSRVCLAANVLDLKNEDGTPLAADATSDQKLEAANRAPWQDKLKAYRGAVNAAIAKTGASPLEIPAMPPGGKTEKPVVKGRDRMKAAMKIEGMNCRRN